MIIRTATEADLPAVYHVWYLNETRGDPNPPAPRADDSTFAWELQTGRMVVAEQDGELIGFAATLTRSDLVYLAELFVRPDHQSTGVGRALLDAVMPDNGRGQVHWTSASTDHRGLALYTRHGMRPRLPQFWLFGRSTRMKPIPETGLGISLAASGDPELAAWDRELSGRDRAIDIQHWHEVSGAIPLWITKSGQRVGYAYVHPSSPDALWNADAPTIGPIGIHTSRDAVGAVLTVIRWAMTMHHPLKMRMLVPGPNLALPSLLDLGFHITYVETYCSNRDQPIYDPARYVCAGAWM